MKKIKLFVIMLLAVTMAACGSNEAAVGNNTVVSSSAEITSDEELPSDTELSSNIVQEMEITSYELPTVAEESEIYVEPIKGISDDFIRGFDASEVLAQEKSGVIYYNENGEEQDVFETLAQAGINYIRLRVWNDPYDEGGNGYGGGNNDVATAITLGQRATTYGMKVLIDFHYSDFWADPDRQLAPKAWEGMTLDEKETALYEFTYSSLEEIIRAGVNVGMVQVGNETNNGMAGEEDSDNVAILMSAGSKAIREISQKYDMDILVALHYTNSTDYDRIDGIINSLEENNVDYDVFGLSYYPYWSGSFEQLAEVMNNIHDNYGKDAMIAEVSYPYTSEDGDGYANSAEGGEMTKGYTSSVQSQATLIRDVCALANESNALGVFYWGGIWIPVGNDNTKNKEIWETYGSGWASSYASGYDPENVGDYYGGCAWDNQALFDFEGHPLASLHVFKYLAYGTIAEAKIDYIPTCNMQISIGKELELPASIPAIYNNRSLNADISVEWKTDDVDKIDTNIEGEYEISGIAENGDAILGIVTVGYVNMALNSGFEEEDYSMWKVTYDGSSNPTDFQENAADAYTGDFAFHFWSENDMSFSLEQTVTGIEDGTYKVSVYSQGGDMSSDSILELYAIVKDEEYTVEFMDTGWAEWQTPEITDIPVTDGTITIGVRMSVNGGSWGTLDDFSLYKIDE